MPTRSSSSTERSHASFFPIFWWDWIISTIWSPMRCTGFNAESGSWKIIATRLPRTRLITFLEAPTSSVPPTCRRTLDARRLREQAHQPEERHRLAGAGLPDDAEHLALIDVEVDAADRLDVAEHGRERDPEVAQSQNGVRSPATTALQLGVGGVAQPVADEVDRPA